MIMLIIFVCYYEINRLEKYIKTYPTDNTIKKHFLIVRAFGKKCTFSSYFLYCTHVILILECNKNFYRFIPATYTYKIKFFWVISLLILLKKNACGYSVIITYFE